MRYIFIEKAAREYALTHKLIGFLRHFKPVIIESGDILKDIPIEDAKKYLLLAVHRGKFIKPFPTFPGLVSGRRDFFVFHNYNCPMDCQYCFLQSYFEHFVPTIFVNQEQMLFELFQHAREVGGKYYFGEMGDALIFERAVGLLERVNRWAYLAPRAVFEFRTKSAYVPEVSAASKRIILAWTITPNSYIERYETGTASLNQRLKAAQLAQSKGYYVALHFDPIIATEGWESEYQETIEKVFSYLDPARIDKISLGVLRFNKELQGKILARFGYTSLMGGEFYEGIDRKYRYFRYRRTKIYRFLLEQLKQYFKHTLKEKVYLCMETPEVWRDVFANMPD